MLLLAVFALVLVSVPLAGGSLRALARVRLRMMWTVAVATVLQVLIIEVAPEADRRLLVAGHLLSYAVAAVFIVANRRLFGMWLVALGAASNALVIAVNGGTMPADPDALARSGSVLDPTEFENSAPVADARLAFLGDVFATPRWLPLANVFSIGDVLLVAGCALVVHWLCGSRLIPPSIRPAFPSPADDRSAEAAALGDPEPKRAGDRPNPAG
jgi:hypothetical protein